MYSPGGVCVCFTLHNICFRPSSTPSLLSQSRTPSGRVPAPVVAPTMPNIADETEHLKNAFMLYLKENIVSEMEKEKHVRLHLLSMHSPQSKRERERERERESILVGFHAEVKICGCGGWYAMCNEHLCMTCFFFCV